MLVQFNAQHFHGLYETTGFSYIAARQFFLHPASAQFYENLMSNFFSHNYRFLTQLAPHLMKTVTMMQLEQRVLVK